jgi:glycosyltransferase involved in cell wall biosynthesis
VAKPKLFVWCDSPTVPTGFGIVAKNLLRDAHKDFDVNILGINEFGRNKYDQSKWFIYPVDGMDPLGFKRIKDILTDLQPDLIWLFQDIFHIQSILPPVKEVCPKIPIIIYFPVDGTPFNTDWQLSFAPGIVQTHVTYSQFGVDAIYERFPMLKEEIDKKIVIKTLYHGCDLDTFKLLSKQQRRDVRKRLGWKDKFVAININRFQPRKILPLTMRAFSLVIHGYKKCKCGNFYLTEKKKCDLNGCGPEQILQEVAPKEDILLYLHCNTMERTMGPPKANVLQAHAINAGFGDQDIKHHRLQFIENRNIIKDPFSEEALCEFYNAADINITTTLGEGWGLSLSEAAACGTRSIAPRNSAIPEVLAGTNSRLIKNIAHMNMGLDSGHLRPLVSVPRFVEAIEAEYKEWIANDRKKLIDHDAIEMVKHRLDWKDKREWIVKEFKNLVPQFFE